MTEIIKFNTEKADTVQFIVSYPKHRQGYMDCFVLRCVREHVLMLLLMTEGTIEKDITESKDEDISKYHQVTCDAHCLSPNRCFWIGSVLYSTTDPKMKLYVPTIKNALDKG